ncbi:restriction endonuclease [Mycobacteroides abscessus]|uniref:restriction endonuclease n=1 Tax=Mycobacteroides abscessus TaxID=36809 RepID=UPI002351DC61|nr:restriction endonuclease [Mycobacteroides abscessus]
MGRKWIGIDITYIAIDLIKARLQDTYGDSVIGPDDITGIPKDVAGARALFAHSAFEFERWAVSLVGAESNQKQVADKGIDGRARFPVDGKGGVGKILVSVKGGKTVGPDAVRELRGVVEREADAHMGVLITLSAATRGVRDEIDHGGTYKLPANSEIYPRLQHITVGELLDGKRLDLPATERPYIRARKLSVKASTEALFDV